MANLGNLIVRGVTRILGDAYANKFIGNLQGNADTATSAIKASTADSATSATSANKASIATAVQDYGTSSYREIKIGYSGNGLSSSTITHAVGFTDSGTKIKNISKDEFRNWLATASGTWPITVSNSSNSANAEYANHLNVIAGNEFRFGNISSDQTVLWFNYANPDGTQNNVSRYYFGDGKHGTNSTIIAAQFTGNAATATNADTLDGVHYQNILERPCSGSNSSGTATGWFRIAETLAHDSGGTTFLLAIQRSYSYTNNESYLFSISISYNGGISITQLSGYANTRLITKIRVDWANSQIAYVDMYINTSYTNNNYYWYTVGCAKSYTAWTANPTLVGNAYEFITVQGCKSDRGFTGDIVGNASSSSKWATARTISLTGSVTGSVSLDGSANVTLATTTNHTHTFDSLTSKPTTISEYGIVDSIRLMNDSSGLYVGARSNYGENMTGSKYLEWWNSAGWVHHKAGKFSVPGGTSSQFLKADGSLDSTTYLPLSGGTLTGSVTMLGINTNLVRDIVYDSTGGWSRGLITLRVDGIDKFNVGAFGDYTVGASSNGIYYGYIGCNSYDGLNLRISATSLSWGDNSILHAGNYNSYSPKLDGTGATGTWNINISGNAVTATNAENATNARSVNGVSLTWDGEITSSQWIAAWESGTSIKPMSAYNTFISMCSYLDEGSSDVTDGTMFITSYATDNGFADPNNKNKPYKRKASLLWNYINNKCSSIYATTTWVNSNFYTCYESNNRYIQSETDPIWTADKVNYYTKTESDSRYIQSETDPVWTAAKGNYYTKTECNNKFQPKGTYLTEQNLQGYATQEWVRGEEYLYRSGGTMDARAEIGITTKLFIGNSTSSDTCYTKFNCILHGGGDESNPNWVIHDNGYSEFKSSVSANAFYASSDIRLKNILDDINIDFDKLKLIPKKYYTWKGSDILQLGTIAQDIQKIYPEVVSKNENGYLSVDYSKLSIIALAAIDKLNERIKELECQIKL